MPRFFVPDGSISGGRAVVEGADAHHLARSLRVQPGERLSLVAGGTEHGVRVDHVTPGRVEGAVEWSRPVTGEPALQVHVIQALPKDGMDEAVDSLVQAGAVSIRPVLTERTVARPDERRASMRVERWQAIARSAAGLAYRGAVPHVHPLRPLAAAVQALPERTRLLMCDFEVPDAMLLTDVRFEATLPVALCIGPEGGWSDGDRAVMLAAGAQVVHFGPRVFRARLVGSIAVLLALAAAGELGAQMAPPPG